MKSKLILIFALSVFGLLTISACERKPAPPTIGVHLGYHCPMHPQYHSDKPGNCPICQMTLVKDEPSDLGNSNLDAARRSSDTVAGQANVQNPAGREQMIGVKLARVETRDLDDVVRASAKIAYDPG